MMKMRSDITWTDVRTIDKLVGNQSQIILLKFEKKIYKRNKKGDEMNRNIRIIMLTKAVIIHKN